MGVPKINGSGVNVGVTLGVEVGAGITVKSAGANPKSRIGSGLFHPITTNVMMMRNAAIPSAPSATLILNKDE